MSKFEEREYSAPWERDIYYNIQNYTGVGRNTNFWADTIGIKKKITVKVFILN